MPQDYFYLVSEIQHPSGRVFGLKRFEDYESARIYAMEIDNRLQGYGFPKAALDYSNETVARYYTESGDCGAAILIQTVKVSQ